MKRSISESLSGIFFWRKDRTSGGPVNTSSDLNQMTPALNGAESDKPDLPRGVTENRDKDWVYVGDDEEGTPVYLDRRRMVLPTGPAAARVWLKHIPNDRARSFEQAQKYLKETGADWKSFCCIEQLLEIDLDRSLFADLVLLFFDRSGRLIEEVRFQEHTHRPLGKEAFWSAIKEMLTAPDTMPDNRPDPSSDESTIDERIELKLQEINSALEAFDTCADAENPNRGKQAKSKPSR